MKYLIGLLVVLFSSNGWSAYTGLFRCEIYGGVPTLVTGTIGGDVRFRTKEIDRTFSGSEVAANYLEQDREDTRFFVSIVDSEGYELIQIDVNDHLGYSSVSMGDLYMKDAMSYCWY